MRLATLFTKFFALMLVVGICVWTVGCGAPADNGGSDTTTTPDLGESTDTPDEAAETDTDADTDADEDEDTPADEPVAGSTTGGGVDVPDEPAE